MVFPFSLRAKPRQTNLLEYKVIHTISFKIENSLPLAVPATTTAWHQYSLGGTNVHQRITPPAKLYYTILFFFIEKMFLRKRLWVCRFFRRNTSLWPANFVRNTFRLFFTSFRDIYLNLNRSRKQLDNSRCMTLFSLLKNKEHFDSSFVDFP